MLSTQPDEYKAIIKRFNRTSDAGVREELRALTSPDGVHIIAHFDSELSKFRTAMRQLDPELDARLALWRIGGVQTTLTDAASVRYVALRKQYGFRN